MRPPIPLPSHNTACLWLLNKKHFYLSHDVSPHDIGLQHLPKQCQHFMDWCLPLWCLSAMCPNDVAILQCNVSSCNVAILRHNVSPPSAIDVSPCDICHWQQGLPPKAWHLMVQGISPTTSSPPDSWHLMAWGNVCLHIVDISQHDIISLSTMPPPVRHNVSLCIILPTTLPPNSKT